MRLGQVGRFVVVAAVVSLLLGVSAQAAGAASTKEYSDSDCEVVQSVDIDSSSGSGYYGATARKASAAFGDAAGDIEDGTLKSALQTLSRVFGAVGRERTVIGASKRLAKAPKSYPKALETWVGAVSSCQGKVLHSTTSTTEADDE
jgi:hypothetical protein